VPNGKKTIAVYASAARTATPTAVTVGMGKFKGCVVIIDTTAAGASPSTVPTIEGVSSSGAVYPLLTGAAITGTGRVALKVYPGITAATNVAVSDVAPEQVKITMTHGNATSHTYSVELVAIP
jgi:hypothetical protein